MKERPFISSFLKLILFNLICLICFSQTVQAQAPIAVTDTFQANAGDTLWLTYPYLVPFSETIFEATGAKLPKDAYEVAYQAGWVRIIREDIRDSQLRIAYRYFSIQPQEEVAIREFRLIKDTINNEKQIDVIINKELARDQVVVWETSRIKKSGSISRGITVGNNQGLAVTSGLRLELEGDLGDGLKIFGAITDENIPIQPDGTTQQISDFDKIFIQLSKDDISLTIGDYEISHRGTRFANFYRNVQGLRLGADLENTKVFLSGAVAKGQFHTNSFIGQEGVSGPYRLTGKNGERFFTVLAGSETIYLNGKRMQRGENNDYIIDYNSAQVTFTARHVITNITRIVVDFEYTDRNFNRSLMVAQLDQKLLNDKLKLKFSYGRDADNQNAPFNDAEAFNAVRDTLRNVGDDLSLATTSGIVEAGYSSTEPRYERRDTLINGNVFERYLFSQDSLNAVYRIFFSFVGEGNGMYEKDQTGINNNIFMWVGPDSLGIPTGSWAPVRTWALPRLLQVADMDVSYQITDKLKIYSETAISLEDQNRLSILDDNDNTDYANFSGISLTNLKITDSINWGLDLSHQYVGKNYTNLDRLYKAEYGRVWNFEESDQRANEQILQGKWKLNYKNKLLLQAEGGMRNTGKGNVAIRQVYTVNSALPKFFQGTYSYTNIRNQVDSIRRDSRWQRHEGDVFLKIWKLQPGVEIWIEDRDEQRADTASTGSFSFVDLKPYIRTFNSKIFEADFSINYRLDKEFSEGILRTKSKAITHYYKWALKPGQNLRIQNITSFRNFQVVDSLFFSKGLNNSQVLTTNLQSTYSTKNRFLYSNFIYEVAAEQVARKEVSFLEVNPGQGEYEWIDYNGNELQEVDEFELSTNPLIANFIRVIRPTQELFPTTRLSFSGSLRMDFKRLFRKKSKGLTNFLRNIRLLTNFRASQNKRKGEELADFIISFQDFLTDTTLLDATYNFRQDVNFFQNSPKGDFRFTYLDNKSRQFLSTGSESRAFTYLGATQRLNLGSSKSIENETRIGTKQTIAEKFSTRNFDIDFVQTNPRVNFQFSRKFRFSVGYEFRHKENTKDTLTVTQLDTIITQRAITHKAIFDAKWNLKDRNNIFTRLELISINQNRSAGFAADYELRDGLQPGFNGIWQVFLTFYLFKNVELSMTYDGRAAQNRPIAHSGRVQIRAFF